MKKITLKKDIFHPLKSKKKNNLNSTNSKLDDYKIGKQNKKIGLFGFFALTASIIMNIFLYPSFASSGYSTIFFLLIGGFLWFIPVALCSAEMATNSAWRQKGGLFSWTSEMFGKKWGWAAIFYQWFQTTIIYFVVLDFIVTGFAYMAGSPNFFNEADHVAIKWIIMIVVFGFLTSLNMLGIKVNVIVARLGLFGGVILPAFLLITFSFFSVGSNLIPINPTFGNISSNNIVPSIGQGVQSISVLVIFSTFVLSYTGLEESASTIRKLKNPHRNYPIAVSILVVLIILFSSLGSIAIVIIPASPIQQANPLTNGVYAVFETIIVTHNVFGLSLIGQTTLFHFITFLVFFGAMSQINSIIIGPSTGVLAAFEEMNFPPIFNKKNRFGVHYNILFIQYALMIFWTTVINFTSGASDLSFTICVNLTAVTYLTGYILLFISYLRLAWSKKLKTAKRGLKIPGGKYIQSTVALSGLIVSILTMIITFFNPGISNASYIIYLGVLLPLFIFSISIPFFVYEINKKYWSKKQIKDFLLSINEIQNFKNILKKFRNKQKRLEAIDYLEFKGMKTSNLKWQEYYSLKERDFSTGSEKVKNLEEFKKFWK